MLIQFPLILSQRGNDETDWIKFVFGGIVFLIWIISAIVSSINKKQEEQRRRRVREQLEHEQIPSMPAPAQRSEPQRRPIEWRPDLPLRTPAPPKPRKTARSAPRPPAARPAPRRAPARAVPIQAFESTSAVDLTPTRPVAATQISDAATSTRAQPPVASAQSIARWLNPQTLRQQFILTELLQLPMALREDTR